MECTGLANGSNIDVGYVELCLEENMMKAGPELDVAVAERVMGCEAVGISGGHVTAWRWNAAIYEDEQYLVSSYSTDWAAAGQVVERLMSAHKYNYMQLEFNDERWDCSICLEGHGWGRGDSKTAPHAICLAALAALEKGG